MISLRVDIQNPWWKNHMNGLFRNYLCFEYAVTKHKTFELEVTRHFWFLFEFDIDLNWRGEDHAGPKLCINILGYALNLSLRDNRHWNDKENRWVNYDNPEEVKEYW